MNQLFYGDNLTVLKNTMGDESVDIIYLDPPFNSQANYNVLFRGTSGSSPTRRSRRSLIRGTGATKRNSHSMVS